MTAIPRASRHWSAARGTGPKRAIARVRASIGTQTGGDVLLGLARDVERELLVELAFDAVGNHQCANPQEEVAEVQTVTPVVRHGVE